MQPNFFAFAKTPIIAGRAFGDADNRPEARVIIDREQVADLGLDLASVGRGTGPRTWSGCRPTLFAGEGRKVKPCSKARGSSTA